MMVLNNKKQRTNGTCNEMGKFYGHVEQKNPNPKKVNNSTYMKFQNMQN